MGHLSFADALKPVIVREVIVGSPYGTTKVGEIAKKMSGDAMYREFAYGAGIIDLNSAMNPRLVYEETVDNFRTWFEDALDETDLLSHFRLNIPYLSGTFPQTTSPKNDRTWSCVFRRKAMSVESGPSTYTATLTISETNLQLRKTQISATVHPSRLDFAGYGDEKEFTVTIKLAHTRASGFGLLSGVLTWKKADNNNMIIVNSPVVLSGCF